ncbi:MAG: hypothetical protein J1E65_03790 [Lachnospiraceae bacterium]|nr:hypothetical protein [Lachnospiraceae bacterium]
MEKRILAYRKYMDELLKQLQDGEIAPEEVERLKKEHMTQVSFFQHERLIHLIVTVTFAILEMLALFLFMLCPGIAVFCLVVIILVLLVPYIRHYYILENEVQKMYRQYDALCEKQGNKTFFL